MSASDKGMPTPRTDAAEFDGHSASWEGGPGQMVVPSEVARELERELAATQVSLEAEIEARLAAEAANSERESATRAIDPTDKALIWKVANVPVSGHYRMEGTTKVELVGTDAAEKILQLLASSTDRGAKNG